MTTEAPKNESKSLAAKSTTAQLGELLASRKAAIEQIVPKHLTAERLMRVAVNCVAKTPALQKCSPTSLLQCVLLAAEIGLEPGGALGQLYLVPFGDKCTAIIGYRGFLELARRTGQLKSIRAVVVYAKEKFTVREGLHFDIVHERSFAPDRGEPVLVYAVAELEDGGIQFEVMTKAQVEAVRARSKAGGSGPWVSDWEEMAKKTVFRRLAKWLPMASERFDKALETDNDEYIDGETGEVVAASDAGVALKEKVKRRMTVVDAVAQEVPAEEVKTEAPAQEVSP